VNTAVRQPGRQEPNAGKNRGRMSFIKDLGSFVLRFVCLPNIPFLVLGSFIYFDRPLINLDYIVLGLFAPLFSKGVNLALFLLWLIGDLFVSATSIFRLPISDFIRATANIPQLSIFVLAPLLLPVLLLIIVLVKVASLFKAPRNYRTAWPGVIVLLAFTLINFTSADGWFKDHLGRQSDKFSDSALWRFAYAAVMDFRTPTLNESDFWRVSSATNKVQAALKSNPSSLPDKVVLVLVESWGLSKTPLIRDRIVAPFLTEAVRSRYIIRQRAVPFKGSTVAAEIRELCGVRGGFRETRLDGKTLSACLPAQFQSSGYATTSIHGFTQSMFNRHHWYPNIGFQQEFFKDNWPKDIPSDLCGSLFVGICDVDAGKLLHHVLLTGPKKHFVYWLTLDSHLQFDEKSHFRCDENIPELLCDLSTSLQKVISVVADIAMDPLLPPTRFIVVGDHAPPILDPNLRRQFSSSEVPSIELVPR
jgi:hypothetical protein